MPQPYKVCSYCQQKAVPTMQPCGRCGNPFPANAQIVYPLSPPVGQVQTAQEMSASSQPDPQSPQNNSFTSILGQLLIATIVGAVAPLKLMPRGGQGIKAEELPVCVVGFGAVGFCAGLMLVLNDIARKGTEQSKSRGESAAKWQFLHLMAALLIVPVVIGFCFLMTFLLH